MKFLVLITRHDLTDIPISVGTVRSHIMDIDEQTATELKDKFDKVFDCHGDGNDEYYDIEFISLEQQPWSAEQAERWLAEFKDDNDISDDDLAKRESCDLTIDEDELDEYEDDEE